MMLKWVTFLLMTLFGAIGMTACSSVNSVAPFDDQQIDNWIRANFPAASHHAMLNSAPPRHPTRQKVDPNGICPIGQVES